MADFIYENHDWGSEDIAFKNNMISFFGAGDWKRKTAEACSWIGLENTDEYFNFINSISDPAEKLGFINTIQQRNYINDANSNCN